MCKKENTTGHGQNVCKTSYFFVEGQTQYASSQERLLAQDQDLDYIIKKHCLLYMHSTYADTVRL